MEYASRGIANTALGLGIAGAVGTAAGLLGDMGGLGGLFGSRQPADPGDRFVTRHEMDLYQQINDKNIQLAEMRSTAYTDRLIGEQSVWNATQTGIINCIGAQVKQLQEMTKLYIPSTNIAFPAPVPTTGNDVAQTGTNG